jgi:hypothetical protein
MVYDSAFPAVDRTVTDRLQSQQSVNQQSVVDTVRQQQTNDIFNALNGAAANSQQALTYGMYLSRNKTIADIAVDMTNQNKKLNSGAKDTYTRQAEINEWAAQNKIDTLFFLQASFLFLCVVTVLVFLRQYGIMPSSAMFMAIGIMLLILLGILWNRASYTMGSRDKRYWNRRFIGLDDGGSGLQSKLQCNITT